MRPILVPNRGYILGGGEVGAEQLGRGLLERGIDPLVVLPTPGPLLADAEIPRYECSVHELANVLRSLASGADLVHTYSAQGLRAAHKAATGLPLVLHSLVATPTSSDESLAAMADVIIANSRATAERFAGASNVRVVYNGVARPPEGDGSSPLTRPGRRSIAVVGALCPRKGQIDALPALLRVCARRSDVDVVFIGRATGVYAGLVRRVVADHRQVRVVGFVPDAGTHLGAFDLVLVPSRSEGFGRVAVESLRAGTPVLARRVGGLVEVLAEVPDPWLGEQRSGWASRIERMLDEPNATPEQLRAAAAPFDVGVFVDRIVGIYREVLAARRAEL
jgi:glycosyltransferase involved in cell wall biosynthesis